MNDETNPRPADPPRAAKQRRPYRQPRLRRFGTLADVTNATMMTGAADGGTMAGMTMT
jgi:hypothetical protein